MTALDHPCSHPPGAVVDDLPELLRRTASGDSAAFAEFYDRTAGRVYGMVLRVLRDPGFSEETTQEVFLHVWRNAANFHPDRGSAVSWLLTIAHGRAVDRVRSESAAARRTVDYGIADFERPHDDVGVAVETRDARRRVMVALEDLTDTQRESVLLAYYGGLSYSQVAERLSIPLPTVKSRIRDGLRRLRAGLGEFD